MWDGLLIDPIVREKVGEKANQQASAKTKVEVKAMEEESRRLRLEKKAKHTKGFCQQQIFNNPHRLCMRRK